jgi:acetyl-CoA acetyltransferase
VTAGNASGIADGAAAVLVMSEDAAKVRGLVPLAVIEGHAISGVDPKVMGLGPVPSTRALLKRVGRDLRAPTTSSNSTKPSRRRCLPATGISASTPSV